MPALPALDKTQAGIDIFIYYRH